MDNVVYVGQSQALHWWPGAMLAFGVAGWFLGGPALTIGLMLPAVFIGLVLPWRFEVLDRGIALWFPFGRYRYLAKEQVTVRVGHGATVVLPRHADRFGYALTDGLIEQRRSVLRAVLAEHGYDLTR
jgi:hypothetical protein